MRVFAALPLPSAAALVLVQQAERLKHDFPALKTVKREGLHITLSFFGELNKQELEALKGLMDFCVGRLILFQSVLKRDGAEYTPLTTLVFQQGCAHEGS